MKEKPCPICGKIHVGKPDPYYNEGTNENKKYAFIFSCPGRFEKDSGYPVSGETGNIFNLVLENLEIKEKKQCRYEFRITNATTNVEFKTEGGTGRTQAKNSEVLDPNNIERLLEEVKDCDKIICFGAKARLAVSKMAKEYPGIIKEDTICVNHLSPMAFIRLPEVARTRIGIAGHICKCILDEKYQLKNINKKRK